MKIYYPIYNKIYNKMKTISKKKLDLQFDVEHSIKINYKKFNDTRFIFILSNYNDSNIIQNNISYIKILYHYLLFHNIKKDIFFNLYMV